MNRISGTLANRPAALSAVGAFYLATDNDVVYHSVSGRWVVRAQQRLGDFTGVKAVATYADLPTAGGNIGWIFETTGNGNLYEGFPGGWHNATAEVLGLGTPSGPTAASVGFDNVESDLAAETVQDAVDELDGRIDEIESAPASGGAISNPKVAYVRSDGNNSTAVIGNPALPFVTAQAAANAMAAASGGSYTMRLGTGTFGGIIYTAQIADRLRSIIGEGPSVSLLGGITASGANSAAGTSESVEGGFGGNGIDINLIGDGTVNLGDVIVSGGIGGDGSVSTDGESGGNGGVGGAAGALNLEGFHLINIIADGGSGGSGASGNNTNGAGGDGGPVSSITLKHCTFNNLSQGAGTGGSGADTVGNNGSGAAPMLVSWCDYTDINNPSEQATNLAAYIVHSIYRGTPGVAQTLDAVFVS